MFSPELRDLAIEVLSAADQAKLKLATAESCTGGLIAACLTEIAGSSSVVDRGFVTYSNEAKTELLGVAAGLIKSSGAVSEDVARAMAVGALANSRADLVVTVTGVAGPGGGTTEKPVGTVHMASARKDGNTVHVLLQLGDLGREKVREATVKAALEHLLGRIRGSG